MFPQENWVEGGGLERRRDVEGGGGYTTILIFCVL